MIQGLSGANVQYSQNEPEIDHIFPRAELRKLGFEEGDIHDLANFWILAKGKNRNKSSKQPSDYFADVDDITLSNALIDRRLLDYGQYLHFIRYRRTAMLRRLREKIGLENSDFQRAY